MSEPFSPRPAVSGELLRLLVFGFGLVSLYGAAQAASELRSILVCSGAMGGTRR
jgi:hypothetical protein